MKTRLTFGAVVALALAVTALLSGPQLVEHVGRTLAQLATSPAAVALVVLAMILQVAGHLLRSMKHRELLRIIRPIGFMQVFRGQMIGFAISALLPFRAGDVVRAHYIGRSVQISRAAVFATIIFERLLDLCVVVLVGAVGLAATGWPVAASFEVLMIASVGIAGAFAAILLISARQPAWFLSLIYRTTGLLTDRLRDRSRHIVWSFTHAMSYALPSRLVLLRYVAMTAAMWTIYFASIRVALAAVGDGIASGAGAVAVVGAPYLGVSTWLGPAYFNEYLSRALGVLGPWLGGADATTFVVITWTLLVVPSVLLGAACLLHRRLVEHVDGETLAPLVRNKLFREENTSSEFAHLLAAHFQGNPLSRIVSREESLGRFTVLQALKGGSNAATLLVWQDGETVVKKVTLPAYRSKLESQYEWLAARETAPQIVGVVGRRDGGDHFDIDIEYREGHVSFFEYLHASSREAAWRVLDEVIRFMEVEVYRPRPVVDREKVLDQYILTKVSQKVVDTAAISPAVSQLLGHDSIVVNGVRLANLPRIIEEIRSNDAAWADLCDFQEEDVHGDLTIDNLMVAPTTGDVMIIDPNDENIVSDRLVDYSKILQSLHSGYEFLVANRAVTVSGDSIVFEERRSAQYEYLFSRSRDVFDGLLGRRRARALLFHEAVHYCRMLTYRAQIDPDSVAMYYAIATRLMNEFSAQYSHDVNSTRGLDAADADGSSGVSFEGTRRSA